MVRDKSEFLTIRITPQLRSILKQRAEFNHRTISSEAIYLIESGLAAGNEQLRDIFKLMGHINDQSAFETEAPK